MQERRILAVTVSGFRALQPPLSLMQPLQGNHTLWIPSPDAPVVLLPIEVRCPLKVIKSQLPQLQTLEANSILHLFLGCQGFFFASVTEPIIPLEHISPLTGTAHTRTVLLHSPYSILHQWFLTLVAQLNH